MKQEKGDNDSSRIYAIQHQFMVNTIKGAFSPA